MTWPKPTHVMIIGATQKGKTTYANRMHRTFHKVSIFVDTKGIDPLWGTRVRSLANLSETLMLGDKIVYDPPRRADGIVWEEAHRDLLSLWSRVQAAAIRCKWSSERPPQIQVKVDEVHRWQSPYTNEEGKTVRPPDTIEDMATRGLGMGLRLGCITQYPAGLRTETRNCLDTRIVYGLGDEGRRCIRSWGWPEPAITAWTNHPYHFASSHPALGWRLHCPTPRGQACPDCGRAAGDGPRAIPS